MLEETGKYQPPASGHRSRELEWRRTHGEFLHSFAGQWVVLEREEIIAYGGDPLKVLAEARGKGIQVPYIFYVESSADDVMTMGLYRVPTGSPRVRNSSVYSGWVVL
jgi:hypothetical protein